LIFAGVFDIEYTVWNLRVVFANYNGWTIATTVS